MKEYAPTNVNNLLIQNLNDTSSNAQRRRLLRALELAGDDGISTLEARTELNILAPAARAFELRWQEGRNIQSHRVSQQDDQGRSHHVARYILRAGKWEGAI
ncbi:helix-turn-helix domain-containing protein [Simiduia curdlanivorans]|uniref:Helix-turn-helix domain-containing protein n=1 Tax=Simiduia curdlanivorans TaxID=1492769 RepID=A0ABV8V6A4_9GAMM|nr:helix-turn-helix domain-containing protein [Simiduia curdlanivorans]MDN3638746.1 helix-turn-helix domain-containing protein [Simiduia curdlanivorans]